MTENIEWFVGFDWASQIHVACLLDRNGRVVAERELKHGGAELAEFYDWLIAKTGAPPARIGVAIETPHGPVVEMLLERGFAVFAINPKQLDRFRDRFTVAGAKDDRRARMCWATACAPIGAPFGGWRSMIPRSSSCANGRASPTS
jgi:hypothetical protein